MNSLSLRHVVLQCLPGFSDWEIWRNMGRYIMNIHPAVCTNHMICAIRREMEILQWTCDFKLKHDLIFHRLVEIHIKDGSSFLGLSWETRKRSRPWQWRFWGRFYLFNSFVSIVSIKGIDPRDPHKFEEQLVIFLATLHFLVFSLIFAHSKGIQRYGGYLFGFPYVRPNFCGDQGNSVVFFGKFHI